MSNILVDSKVYHAVGNNIGCALPCWICLP